ncbi:MAG: APC family permease [Alphaproteobacteria bacterium]
MMAKSFGIYFTALLKGTDYSWMTVNEFAAVLIVGLALLNMMSAGDVGRAEILLVTLKILILGSLIGAAMWNADLTLSNVLPQPTLMSFWGAIGVTFFAYAGYGVITNAAADVQHPKRTIRLGIYITILAVMALYMALAHVVLNFIPAADLEKNADTAVAVAADKLLGKWGYGLIYVAAVMAFVSGINATFFSIFRISRSLAEQGVLPKIYEKVLERNLRQYSDFDHCSVGGDIYGFFFHCQSVQRRLSGKLSGNFCRKLAFAAGDRFIENPYSGRIWTYVVYSDRIYCQYCCRLSRSVGNF